MKRIIGAIVILAVIFGTSIGITISSTIILKR